MLINLGADGHLKLAETCETLSPDEFLGQLTEECGEFIQALTELQDAIGDSMIFTRSIRKLSGLIQAAQKVRRARNGTTPVCLDDALVHLNEECADVALCIDALTMVGLVDGNGVQFIGRYKNARWHERVCKK